MTQKNHTLIVGAGITGMSIALLLADQQHSITLLDAKPALNDDEWQSRLGQRDARVYALSPASIELLTSVGAWPLICQSCRHADYTNMQVWQQDGKGQLMFGEDDVPQVLGSMVEPTIIEWALQQRVKAHDNITLLPNTKVTTLDWLGDDTGYAVVDENGHRHLAKLVIGADGRDSYIRALAGIELETLDYNQTAICCAIKTQKPHHATARQLMLPTGTLALLPLANKDDPSSQQWQSVVWTLPTNQALDILMDEPAAIAQALASASQYALGDIEHIESIASFELSAQQAKQYVKPNLALVGDAAHGVHPLAGQGLNLGLQDVKTLVHELEADCRRSGGRAWGDMSTLRRYERRRRPQNSVMMHSFSMLNWLFASEFATFRPVQIARSEGMYRVGKAKPLMRFFTRQASGL